MAISRSTYGTRRLAIVLFACLLIALFLLPSQSQRLLQYVGGPLGQVLSLPLAAFSSVDHGIADIWNGYVALQSVHEENRQLHLREETNLPIITVDDPLTSVVLGVGKILDELDLLRKVSVMSQCSTSR